MILAFSVAAALLLGAVVSWAAAAAGGRHRDGAPMPNWLHTGPGGVTVRYDNMAAKREEIMGIHRVTAPSVDALLCRVRLAGRNGGPMP